MVTSINILSTGEEYVLRMNQKCFNTNPFSNVLTIEIDGNDEILDIEILNTSDQLVFKGEMMNSINIQTGELAKGIYSLKFENETIFEINKIIRK